MQCSDNYERMNRYLDGEIADEREETWQAHLSGCAACRLQWQAMQSLDSMLSAQSLVAPSPGFAARVTARIEARRIRSLRIRALFRVCVTALCLWALAITLVAAIGSIAWPSVMRPTLLEAAGHFLRGVTTFVSVLWEALRSTLEALRVRSVVALLLAYLTLACLITFLWLQVALRRSLPAWLHL